MIWFWIHIALLVLACWAIVKLDIRRSRTISFYTINNGRTFWYQGKEMRASKLTDQLQTAWSRHKAWSGSNAGWKKGDFYDD